MPQQMAVVSVFKKQWGVWWCRQDFEDLLVWLGEELSPRFGGTSACMLLNWCSQAPVLMFKIKACALVSLPSATQETDLQFVLELSISLFLNATSYR